MNVFIFLSFVCCIGLYKLGFVFFFARFICFETGFLCVYLAVLELTGLALIPQKSPASAPQEVGGRHSGRCSAHKVFYKPKVCGHPAELVYKSIYSLSAAFC